METVAANRALIQDDLRGLLAGEVRCDDVHLQLYASDASIYEIRPAAVVRPQSTADVVAVVQYAAEKRIPIHARGAGSGVAGESIGPGIVVDFSRFLRRIVRIESDTVRVQPGVVLERLNEQLRLQGKVFGPDPANAHVTTMGSVIAIDAAGSRWLRYGSARASVRSLQVVLADGSVVELSREPIAATAGAANSAAAGTPNIGANALSGGGPSGGTNAAGGIGAIGGPPTSAGTGDSGLAATDGGLAGGGKGDPDGGATYVETPGVGQLSRKQELVARVLNLLRQHALTIQSNQPRTPINRCGYALADVLTDREIDMARLMVGSEGTLGLITEATLAIQPLRRHRGAALLLFDSLEKASRAVLDVLREGPVACDLMDRRHVSLAREVEPRFDSLIPVETETVLLIEQEGDEPAQVREWIRRIIDDLYREKHLAFAARQAFDAAEIELFWRLLNKFQPALFRIKGPARPVPVVEDVVVPPELLPDFLVRVQNVLKRQQVTGSMFCHAGQGQLHIQPFLDLSSPDDLARMQRLADELYDEVFAVGGTLGGEHACGLSRTPYLRRQVGPLYEVFGQLKAIFDPQGILNPGKIVSDDPQSLTRNLRPSLTAAASEAEAAPQSATADAGATAKAPKPLRNLVELQLSWDPSRVLEATAACNRCGDCRTQGHEMRMCPIFRVSPSEEASPRAKANLLRGILTGSLGLNRLASDDLKQVADLCVYCHACRLECPARVDIPRLMRECKAAYVRSHGLTVTQWAMNHLDLIGAWGSAIGPLTNWAIGNRFARWLLEKAIGIAQGRKLPRVASRSLLRIAARRRWTRLTRHGGRKVAYFVDTYANYFDPQLGRALVAVMKHNGIAVHVPPDQVQSGMAAISSGSLDHARRLARANVAVLAEAVRQGYDIVSTEPSAALCLTREYPQILDGDEDARLVAANSHEACTYLWNLYVKGELRLDFHPLNATVGYHLPCHMRALEVGAPGESLMRLLPGLQVIRVDEGCSGMAGTFGLLRKNYRTSLRAGWGLISRLREARLQFGAAECSSCKLQMEQGTTKPTIHPIKLLALGYGIMPELEAALHLSDEELIAS